MTACTDHGPYLSDRQALSLAGEWESSLGPCILPGTTDENKLGNGEHPVDVTSQLTRTHPFYGAADYVKQVEIPSSFEGKRMVLHMERTKPSTLYVDGELIGSLGHIYAPHEYLLPELAAGPHEIRITIDNSSTSVPREIQGSHAWTDGTQTNWNGILGDFYIEAMPVTYIEDVQVYPSVAQKNALVRVTVSSLAEQKGSIKINSRAWNTDRRHVLPELDEGVELSEGTNVLEFVLEMGDKMLTWSEFHPVLYSLDVNLFTADGNDHSHVDFGMRDFTTDGTQFAINGFKTFLRGKHDACVFPLTGYAPMDVESWRKVFRIAKSYGINYYRCHSYTPPKAAFEAADIEGIYFQAELPLWGSIRRRNVELNDFLVNEARMTLDFLGNHASFTMFGLGNELNGDVTLMREWLDEFRKQDSRHLYSFGSNNNLGWNGPQEGEDYFTTCRVGGGPGYSTHVRSSFAFVDAEQGGILNNTRPNTRADYSGAISKSPVPVIGHETGQFQIYPDYDEIQKYTGVLYPYNLEIFRDRLNENGLQDQADAFHDATGRFSVECYKADIEYSLRTRGLGGFQMLDLQDFPGQGSALVGILDAFMDSKGIVTPEEFRRFCAPVVPLALMDGHCYSSSDELSVDVSVANYIEDDWNETVRWTLTSTDPEHPFFKEGEFKAEILQGDVAPAGTLSADLSEISVPMKLRLDLFTGQYSNYYNIWVYPDSEPVSSDGIHITSEFDADVEKILSEGGSVLLVPDHSAVSVQTVGGLFTPDYWNYAMFKSISENAGKEVSPGTLSLLMDDKHPLFDHFPTESYSNWQWWSIVRNSRPMVLNLTAHSYKPLIQVVDNVERNHKLGLLFEFAVNGGKLLVCMCDLDDVQDTPEGRQFRSSVISYMKSDSFAPQEKMTSAQMLQLLTADPSQRNIVGVENISDYASVQKTN